VGDGEEVPAMATTKDRLAELEDAWVTAPEAPPVPPVARAPLATRLQQPIAPQQALAGMIAWVAGLAIGIAVEPPPANPNAVDPWFVTAMGTILLVALLTTFAGFVLRRRWSLVSSLLAAGLLVVSTVMCPLSGHHAGVGAWWVIQLGCGLALMTASAVGLRQASPR
jgi:uncharacterized membrane protein